MAHHKSPVTLTTSVCAHFIGTGRQMNTNDKERKKSELKIEARSSNDEFRMRIKKGMNGEEERERAIERKR